MYFKHERDALGTTHNWLVIALHSFEPLCEVIAVNIDNDTGTGFHILTHFSRNNYQYTYSYVLILLTLV